MKSVITLGILVGLTDRASAPAQRISDRVAGIGRQFKATFTGLGERLDAAANKLAAVGTSSILAGHAIRAGLRAGAQVYAELDEGLTGLRATLMDAAGQVPAAAKQLGDLAVQLGNVLPGTTNDFARMFDVMIRKGATADTVLGGLGQATAYLALRMKLPYSEAAAFTANLAEQAGVASKEMMPFLDSLNRASQLGASATEMSYAFGRAAGKMKEVGLQGLGAAKSLVPMFAYLLKSLSGETVGTGFGSILGSLQKLQYGLSTEAKKAKQQLKDVGIEMNFFDQKGKFLGIEHFIAQLEQLNKLSARGKAAALSDIFGGGQDASMVASLLDWGTKGHQTDAQRMGRMASLQLQVKEVLKDTKNTVDALSGSLENLQAAMSGPWVEALKPLVRNLNDLVGKANTWADANRDLAKWIGLGLVGISGALTLWGGIALGSAVLARFLGGAAAGAAAGAGAAATGAAVGAGAAATGTAAAAGPRLGPLLLPETAPGAVPAASTGVGWLGWLGRLFGVLGGLAVPNDNIATQAQEEQALRDFATRLQPPPALPQAVAEPLLQLGPAAQTIAQTAQTQDQTARRHQKTGEVARDTADIARGAAELLQTAVRRFEGIVADLHHIGGLIVVQINGPGDVQSVTKTPGSPVDLSAITGRPLAL